MVKFFSLRGVYYGAEVDMNSRKILQLIIFIITAVGGVRFYLYIEALKAGDMTVTKTGIPEGFLPISALMAFKRFVMTGIYDHIHPAGLTLFIFILAVSLIFKKSFCSHVCPVGFISESISSLGRGLRINKWLFHPLTVVKYGILGFFGYLIIIQMPVRAIDSFLRAPYNMVADAKMMHFFTAPSRNTLIVLFAVLVLTFVSKNIWCRLLCPYGALLGLISFLSPFKVKRNPSACIDCRKCTKACPNDIQVHAKKRVDTPECFGCFECVRERHCEECLTVTGGLRYKYAPVIIGVLLAVTVAGAMAGGYWESSVTNQEYARYLNMLKSLGH